MFSETDVLEIKEAFKLGDFTRGTKMCLVSLLKRQRKCNQLTKKVNEQRKIISELEGKIEKLKVDIKNQLSS